MYIQMYLNSILMNVLIWGFQLDTLNYLRMSRLMVVKNLWWFGDGVILMALDMVIVRGQNWESNLDILMDFYLVANGIYWW